MLEGINSQLRAGQNNGYSTTEIKSEQIKSEQGVSEQKKNKNVEEKKEKLLEDVVAKSTDGDTLQENKDSLKALSEGMVFKKEEQSEIKSEISDKKTEKIKEQTDYNIEVKADEHVKSLVGMSKSQVERLYREGKITRREYDANMEKRQEKAQEMADDTSTKDITESDLKNIEISKTVEDIFKAAENGRADLAAQIYG